MHITLNEENKDKVLSASNNLNRSCNWIVNQILKSVRDIKIKEEINLHMDECLVNVELESTSENKKVRRQSSRVDAKST